MTSWSMIFSERDMTSMSSSIFLTFQLQMGWNIVSNLQNFDHLAFFFTIVSNIWNKIVRRPSREIVWVPSKNIFVPYIVHEVEKHVKHFGFWLSIIISTYYNHNPQFIDFEIGIFMLQPLRFLGQWLQIIISI